MKKMLTWLLVIAMVVAMVPMAVSAEEENITVYFRNDWLWSDVYAYYFDSSSSVEWPGIAMTCVETIDGLDYYCAEIPADAAGLIFNGWDAGQNARRQTPDITGSDIQANVCYTIWWNNTEAWKTVDYAVPVEPVEQVMLNPGAWSSDNAWFAAYFYGASGSTWVKMEKDAVSGYYTADVPDGKYANVIFCRMNPASSDLSWDSKWNQTVDLDLPTAESGTELFTIQSNWDGSDGVWSDYVRAIQDNLRTLNVEDEIYINQYVKILGCDGIDVTKNGGLLVWNTAVSEADAVVGSTVAHEQIEGLIAGTGEYAQQTSGISAKNYADKLYLRVYVQLAEGEYLYSDLMEYSVRDYCETQITNNTSSAGVCTQLLHYGAAAQIQFNYNTEDLANANITAASAEWDDSYLTAVTPANTQLVGTGDVKDNGKTLALEGSMKLNFYFKPQNFEAVSGELLVWEDVAEELTLDNASYKVDMVEGTNEYGAQINPVYTRNYGKTIYVCAAFEDAEGNMHYSDVIAYSVEAYAAAILAKTTSSDSIKAVVKQLVLLGEVYASYNAARNA